MTREEAIKFLGSYSAMCFGDAHFGMITMSEIIEMIKDAQPDNDWIPCHDPSDLPKDKRIWITYECDVCGFVFRFVKDVVWDMTEWSDNVSGVVAYMPYIEPEPYEEK